MARVEPRTFTLGGLFTVSEVSYATNIVMFVTDLKGWEEHKVNLVTRPKLFGKGSYVEEFHVPEQEITLTMIIDSTVYNVRGKWEEIRDTMDLGLPVTATRAFLNSGITSSKNVYITELGEIAQWKDTSASFTITMRQIDF